ncbi:hypothetical protein VOLCADRAFT_37559, partial [Volvox carteri f. nagariensis]
FVQEVVVMTSLRHPNIVPLLGASLQPPHVFLLAELCGGGGGGGGDRVSARRILEVALDLARGLEYLHGRNPAVVHRDLKPANVLIDADGTAKV